MSDIPISSLRSPQLVDQLTGLPVRESLERVVEQALSDRQLTSGVVSLLALRLEPSDGWSDVYRRRVLRLIAQGLRGATRATDFVARTGELEFMVLLPDAANEQARSVMARVQSALARHLDIRGQRLNARRIRAMVVTAPDDGDTLGALLDRRRDFSAERETASRTRAG